MKVTRLYTGPDAESHFEEIDIPLKDAGDIGRLLERIPATGIIFRETDGDYHGKRFSSPWIEGAIPNKEGRMADHPWVREFPGAITVCDREGIIIELNDKAAEAYQDRGGRKLIGTSLLDCHPEPARGKLRQLMEARQANVYSIEKGGQKKLIYQAPWYRDGQYGGFVELALEVPARTPHFIRDRGPESS